ELTTSEDAAAPASLVLGAADVDSPAADLTWTVAGKPAHGSVVLSGAGDQQLVQYAPAANYAGEDKFVVRVADDNGGAAEIAVAVTVTPVNDPPGFAQGTRVNVAMDEDGAPTPFRLSLGAEDIDSDVAELAWEIRSAPEHGQAEIAGEGATRSIVYTPARDFTGEDAFVVRVADDAGGTGDIAVNVTVAPVNDAPVIAQGSSTTVEMSEDSAPDAFSLSLAARDVDADPLDWRITEQPQFGQAVLVGGGDSRVVQYNPQPDYNGRDSFVVQVSDGNGGRAAIDVGVVIAAANDAPVILEGETAAVTMSEDSNPIPFSMTINAVDADDDQLKWSIVGEPEHGVAGLSGAGGSRSINYAPAADFAGNDSFTIRVEDGNGGRDEIGIDVFVTAVNDGPIIVEGQSASVTMSEDGVPTPFNLRLHATDADDDQLVWSVLTQPAYGAATLSEEEGGARVAFAPVADFFGADSFVVRAADGNGSFDDIVVTVNVLPVNDAPVIQEGERAVATVSEDGAPVAFDLRLSAADADGDALTWTVAGQPNHGVAAISGAGQSRTISYTPAPNFSGDDSFVIAVADGRGGSASVAVDVEVLPVNDAPVVVGDRTSTRVAAPVTIDVLENDRDADNDRLRVVEVTGARNGTVAINSDNSVTYTPDADFSGEDAFSYTVSDGTAMQTAVVTVDVSGPAAVAQAALPTSTATPAPLVTGAPVAEVTGTESTGTETEATGMTPDVTTPDVITPDVVTPDVVTPDVITPAATVTATRVNDAQASAAAQPVLVPTRTGTAAATVTPQPTATATSTPAPTATPVPTQTPVPTATPAPTATPS
ncbi:MAG: tandem-95 repeat protein, partial [Caldilineaceae bacterium]|nr:tandem-95 repeat protein [Caldilineaceae bacterium]